MATITSITLAAARVNAGLTQKEVAERLHVSNKSIVNWENGNVSPSFATLVTLADMYNVPVDCFSLPTKSALSEPKEED